MAIVAVPVAIDLTPVVLAAVGGYLFGHQFHTAPPPKPPTPPPVPPPVYVPIRNPYTITTATGGVMPVSVAIPIEGQAVYINPLPGFTTLTWDDVENYIQIQAAQNLYQPSTDPLTRARQAAIWATNLSSIGTKVMGGYINLAIDYANDAVTTAQLNMYAAMLPVLQDQLALHIALQGQGQYAYSAVAQLDNQISAVAQQSLAGLNNGLKYALQTIPQWATQEIFWPLETQIFQIEAQVQQLQRTPSGLTTQQVQVMIDNGIAPILALLPALAARLQALEDQARTCVDTMCADYGPGTDFNKFTKLFDFAKLLALAVEIAALNEHAAEYIARTAVSIGAQPARDLVGVWFGI